MNNGAKMSDKSDQETATEIGRFRSVSSGDVYVKLCFL